jgi:hypothetical protein
VIIARPIGRGNDDLSRWHCIELIRKVDSGFRFDASVDEARKPKAGGGQETLET